MESSDEIPDSVTLTRSEAELAQNDPDFFLAMVSGLEEGRGDLRVRFIFDPIHTLAHRITGNVTLAGIRDVEALEYIFKDLDMKPQS